jgi:hypothetical protein
MKRFAMSFAAGAIGMVLTVPCVHAQSWQDMSRDQSAIAAGHEGIHHDRQEQREDLQNGDYAGAAHEQAEINHRRDAVRERRQDLNNDENEAAGRYNGDDDSEYNNSENDNGEHAWRHHHHDKDDND